MTFDRALGPLAGLTEAQLAGPWPFRGKPSTVRYALYHALEEEQRAVIAATRAPTESGRILSLAQSAFGELRGLLAGLDDAVLDRAPAPGEWSLRETLAHTIDVERSYRAGTQYAVSRTAAEPILMPAERRPAPDPAHTAGSIFDILERFAELRAETDAAFSELGDADLARPTVTSGFEVDVRYRLHRFASHVAEHTIQCSKAVVALGATGSDARAMCRRIGAMRGLHERRSDPSRMRELDAALAEKARLASH